MPFGGASAPQPAAPPAPAPPKTFGFPPLRKQSFYPPQPKATPELPPIPAKEPETAKADVVGSQAASGDDDGGLESAIARLTGLGAVVPGQSGSPAQTGHNGASLNGASLNGSASLKDAGGLKGSGSLNGSAALNGSGSLNGAGAFGSLGSASKFSAAPFEPALPDLSVTPDFAPVEPEPVADATEPVVTFDQAPFGARSSVPASDVPPVADAARATVAAQALDALAQGLAASAAAAAQPAIPLTPVVEPAPEALRASGAPHVQTLPVATLAPAQAPSRTLEDAVAEMLRPMLQQWVSDNMPRIIEKALRVEVARNVKPDLASKS